MKIALVVLTGGSVSGGFRKYLERLVPLLREQSEVDLVDVWLPPQMAGPNDLTWPIRDGLRGYRALRRAIEARTPDVVFIPTARSFPAGISPVVTMVRNMEPLEVPFEGNGPVEALRNIGRAWEAKSSSRHSNRVLAVSRHVRDFLVEQWQIPSERVGVVYHGVASSGNDAVPPANLGWLADAPFLFAAGSIRPARGLEDVVEAFGILPARFKLVIAGEIDRNSGHYDRGVRQLARERGVESRVVWAGHLSSGEMSWCFRHAWYFVMTSRAEACPNVVLEAMAEGAASISTDHPPMPEFFGDAALYYRARDSADLSRVLTRALDVPEAVREGLRERARIRARAFTWEATARGTVLELKQAIERCASFT